jgi:uncharacterized repeat protein (TIGR03803 family)
MRCSIEGPATSRFHGRRSGSVRRSMMWIAGASTSILFLFLGRQVSAQTLTTLASFNATNGQFPIAGLTAVGSTLYGTTFTGSGGYGDVYSVPLSGGTPTVLASFNYTDGGHSFAGLTLVGSTLYGTTNVGGAKGDGEVFSIPLSGGTPTVLASFNGTNGENPEAGLTLVGSTLYGTAGYGGTSGDGEVFSVPLSGGTPTVLTSFDAGIGVGGNGGYPRDGLTLIGSTLYGTTYYGGSNGLGEVFSVPLSGGQPTVLASFSSTNGEYPRAGLTLAGSTLYGVATSGGAGGDGEIFSVPLSGGTPTVLTSFNGANGSTPYGNLTLVGSMLYGTTESGGASSNGEVFCVPLSGGQPTILATFNDSNGADPWAGLTLVGSTLYGTTYYGGVNSGNGSVFALLVNELASGHATADKNNSASEFGPALLQIVGQGAGYAGLASTVTATTGSGGGPMLGTTATILAGTNSGNLTGGATTVSMAWRTRTLQETSLHEGGSATSPPLPSTHSPLISDVLNLSGMSNSANEPASSDVFALQMTYDPALLRNEAAQAADGAIYLAWLNPTAGLGGVPLWQNAILGDTGNNATLAEHGFLGSFSAFQTHFNDTNIADYIGAWGIDTANHDVWAVIDHNSDFAVVPEPSSLLLASIGVAGLLIVARKRRAHALNALSTPYRTAPPRSTTSAARIDTSGGTASPARRCWVCRSWGNSKGPLIIREIYERRPPRQAGGSVVGFCCWPG